MLLGETGSRITERFKTFYHKCEAEATVFSRFDSLFFARLLPQPLSLCPPAFPLLLFATGERKRGGSMKIYDVSREVFSCKVYPGDLPPEKLLR